MRPTTKRPQVPTNPAPKGMWFEHRPGRDKPFLARWRVGKGKETQGFETEPERTEFAAAWAKRRELYGKQALTVAPRRLEVWDEFDRRTAGADPLQVADFWLKMRGVAGGNLLVPQALERFREIKAAAAAANAGPDTQPQAPVNGHRSLHLRRFAESFPTRRLNEILPADVRQWLYGKQNALGAPTSPPLLRNPDRADGRFEPVTLVHHLRSVSMMFDVLRTERLVDHNPCEAVEEPNIPEKERPILTPRQAFDLFKENRDTSTIGPLAAEGFGGLRFTSAARLTPDRVKKDLRGLELPGSDHKSKRRKFRQGHPHNLWSFLEAPPASAWDFDLHSYNLAKRAAFARAHLKPPGPAADEAERDQVAALRNVLRYSFATYLLALTANAPLVARLMQHRHTSTTEIYEGRAELASAILYFGITYERTALTWEEFVTAAAAAQPAELVRNLLSNV